MVRQSIKSDRCKSSFFFYLEYSRSYQKLGSSCHTQVLNWLSLKQNSHCTRNQLLTNSKTTTKQFYCNLLELKVISHLLRRPSESTQHHNPHNPRHSLPQLTAPRKVSKCHLVPLSKAILCYTRGHSRPQL